PIYHSHKNSGKPPSAESVVHIDDIDAEAPQLSLGMTSFHLDAGYTPLFPFGFGLSYGRFVYGDLRLDRTDLALGEALEVTVTLTNEGPRGGIEVVQLYVRDLVGSLTRPVRELKAFERVSLDAGDSRSVRFSLHTDQLAFYGRDGHRRTEPGEFALWVGGDAQASLGATFRVLP
ncbi:MAG: fibronectin type III-like domain-contianing protein, partial [Pseudomonadota bacterium]